MVLVAHSSIIFRIDRAAQAKLFRFTIEYDLDDLLAAAASMGNPADGLAVVQKLRARDLNNCYD